MGEGATSLKTTDGFRLGIHDEIVGFGDVQSFGVDIGDTVASLFLARGLDLYESVPPSKSKPTTIFLLVEPVISSYNSSRAPQ